LSSAVTITGLTVNGQPVVVGSAEVRINLLLGVPHINTTTTTATSITTRGIWFESTVLPSSLEVVVAEARAGASRPPLPGPGEEGKPCAIVAPDDATLRGRR
jgi:hypothetical protein